MTAVRRYEYYPLHLSSAGNPWFVFANLTMASEGAPFLPSKETALDRGDTYQAEYTGHRPWSRFGLRSLLLIHLGILILYAVTSIFLVRSQRCTDVQPPAAVDNLHFSYSPTLFHRLNATPYAGPPSPEIDHAWDALLAPMHITVSKAELERSNQDSVALPESGGYLGWLGVFHELHCIVNDLFVVFS